jgi:Kef-type K+ transport system membrane component KefB
MEEHLTFIPLLIVIFLAFAVPLLLSRFRALRLPIVVGELIAGIIVGRSGFGWVAHHDPVLDLLAEFGFVFLMFLSGMEIDFSSLGSLNGKKRGKNEPVLGPLPLAGINFALTLVLSAAAGFAFYRMGLVQNMWMMALILSTTSLGVVVPVLKEKGISGGSYGQSLLVSALIADFATMFLITVLVAAISQGLTLEILLIGVLFAAFFILYRAGLLVNRLKVVRTMIEELSHATAQIKVRAAFTIMLVFVALSETIGTEIILGAFMAGAIVSLLRRQEDEELEHQLNAIGFGFFIPIFFIMVGVDFNLAALTESPQALLLAPLLVLAALVVKFVPAMVFRVVYSWREAFGAGALLSARLSLIIAASAIGLRLGIITESVNSAIVLVSLLTVSFAPVLFNRIIPSAVDARKRLFLVVGASELGIRVAEILSEHHDEVMLVAKNGTQFTRSEQRDVRVVQADSPSNDPALEEYFRQARTVVSTSSDLELSYQVCKLAKRTYGVSHVVARVDDPQEVERFEELGVLPMNLAMDRAALLVILARNPGMYDLLTRTDDDKDVGEVMVTNPGQVGKMVRDLQLPEEVLILALYRGNEYLIPHGDTKLEKGDRLSLFGTIPRLEDAERLFD